METRRFEMKEKDIRNEWMKTERQFEAAKAWAERACVPEQERDFIEKARFEGFRRRFGGNPEKMTNAQRSQKKRLRERLGQYLDDFHYVLSYKEGLGIERGKGWFSRKDWAEILHMPFVAMLVRASVEIHGKKARDVLMRNLLTDLEPDERFVIMREVSP
jgi:hypothetical protein